MTLTPDGWERLKFLADVGRDVKFVRLVPSDLSAALSEIEELRGALRVFAKIAETHRPGSFYANQPDGTHYAPLTTTLGDFRRARLALNPEGDKG